MNTTRRQFIKLSTAASVTVAFGATSTSLFAETSVKPLRILILGGTGFTGPYQVRYALSRGHKVTTFNRGKTHPGELPKEVEQLIGDRNGQLDALRNRQWDVVIDDPTTLPAWVRDAAQILKGNVERYVFISTISVYADTGQGVDETAPLAKYDGPDPYKETIEAVKASGYKTYGPLKVLSEKEAEKWFHGKTLIIRPGLIVGPRDETDRFTYWPVRIDRGGEVLAPGNQRSGAIHRWARSGGVDHSHGRKRRDGNLQRHRPGEGVGDRRHARWDKRRAQFKRDLRMGRCRIS